MNSINKYEGILKSPNWHTKRREIIERDNSQCVICHSKNKLQVHHRQYHIIGNSGQYKLPWDYKSKYLITLCEKCHQKGHELYKVPVFIV